MSNKTAIHDTDTFPATGRSEVYPSVKRRKFLPHIRKPVPEILCITSYPPRECGIATYSQDLIKALNNTFDHAFTLSICSLESAHEKHMYPTDPVKYILNTDEPDAFISLAETIDENTDIELIMVQHEFGFFEKKEVLFRKFLKRTGKPVITVFHTVLPQPGDLLKEEVQQLAAISASVIVMTQTSADILLHDYAIPIRKITVIPHGTHLIAHTDKVFLKNKYHLTGKKVLSTFGLLSSGKSIETTLEALPAIIKKNPDVRFLIIGKTHPSVIKQEGEKYRNRLEALIDTLQLQEYVQFVNRFLPLPDLLEYLQLTDIYLFTSKNPDQAVSGTFAYAISCGCPVISTPIPHAREVIRNDTGIIVDFENPQALSQAVIRLLADENLRKQIGLNGLHRMASTAWENVAYAHAVLFEQISDHAIVLRYNLPVINLEHIKKMTTRFGMIQFAVISQPDLDSGYTLDDNARAMVAMCQYFELTKDENLLPYIYIYFNFLKYCLQPGGDFLNYVSQTGFFTEQNLETNLEDANGRAVWALGYLISLKDLLPDELITDAGSLLEKALPAVNKIHSTRAMAFIIKGLYYKNIKHTSEPEEQMIKEFADRLVQMYKHEAGAGWNWYESYLTYANSILPEAMLCAGLATGEAAYKQIAKSSFDFLLSNIFTENQIKVISNKGWLPKGKIPGELAPGGEQPIDVAYTILALHKFYEAFGEPLYLQRMKTAFSWFLGNNHLQNIIYNPSTGGCYDGLEENYVNLNQGAESTVSYLMARLTLEKLSYEL
jgi:glycosyltransferase involved in cell wall biosynthesis